MNDSTIALHNESFTVAKTERETEDPPLGDARVKCDGGKVARSPDKST